MIPPDDHARSMLNALLACLLFVAIVGGISIAMIDALADEPPSEPGTVEIVDIAGQPWAKYRMNGSTHFIRVSAISAVLQMDQYRSEVYFAGGTLSNYVQQKDFVEAWERYESDKP